MSTDPVEDVLLRWQGWQRAIEARDVEAAREFLAEDFALVLVWPERAVFTRDAWLETLREYVVSSNEIEAQVVDVSGDLAVILHRTRMQATVFGADRSGLFAISDIWRHADGAWRVWRRHSTPLAAGALPTRRGG